MKAMSFEGSGFEYFKIWIVNILLTVITVGLYYPWAKVRNRRYFYANTRFEDRSFEYHATGKQLFIGYLIAMALFIAFVVAQQISPIASGVGFVLFIFALPWIIWRSLKFNLRMTSFSNVRFSFVGGLGNAYINFMVLPVLFFLILYGIPIAAAIVMPSIASDGMSTIVGMLIGFCLVFIPVFALLLFAYIKMRNSHYSVNNSRYGQGQFSTWVETEAFAKIILKTIGIAISSSIVFMLILASIISATIGLSSAFAVLQGMSNPEQMSSGLGSALLVMIFPVYIGLIGIGLFVRAYFYTRQRTYLIENLSLDRHITFVSTLTVRSYVWVLLSNFLLIIVTIGLATPWASVRLARVVIENTQLHSEAGFDKYFTEKQEQQSSLGEQIGDAFDVDMGIGI
jgi:uncharacterized membrane protein YjgN (DUF898 family)